MTGVVWCGVVWYVVWCDVVYFYNGTDFALNVGMAGGFSGR